LYAGLSFVLNGISLTCRNY